MEVIFVVPSRNNAENSTNLLASLLVQTDRRWRAIIVDDMSDVGKQFPDAHDANEPIEVRRNVERKHALRNVVEVAREFPNDVIAVLDGDDQLCNHSTVEILLREYEAGADAVWTAHSWDVNGMNISGPMPEGVDPYQYHWVSSHLKTFHGSLLQKISDANFQDHRGEWFKRGYDQALYLPILHVAEQRKFVPEVCYLYRIDSTSIPLGERNWSERLQGQTVRFVRARGFVE